MDLEELLDKQPKDVAAAIEDVISRAGTCDADWSVLLAAGELLAESYEVIEQLKNELHNPLEL